MPLKDDFVSPKSVTDTVQVWAVPKFAYTDDENKATGKWEFKITDGNPYASGAVKIHQGAVTIEIPHEVDLVEAAIKTVEQEITDARLAHYQKIQDLEKRLKALQALTYQPEERTEEGVTHNGARVYMEDGVRVIDLNAQEDDIPF
jgi:hypothetical protein